MDELAYLNAGVKLIMTDLREGVNDDGTPKKSKEYLHEVSTITTILYMYVHIMHFLCIMGMRHM
jgi:hypothetical protein